MPAMPPASLTAYFSEHDLALSDVPKAVLVHEGIGLGLLVGIWGSCFAVRPTHRILEPLRQASWAPSFLKGHSSSASSSSSSASFQAALAAAEARVAGARWVPAGVDPRRLVVSLAESVVIRNLVRPVTIPLKLWMTYSIVVGGAGWGMIGGEAVGSASGDR